MNTLLLDTVTWDLCKDASGNIAMASNPYALAQNAATAIRTFLGEVWYNTSLGIPYFQNILGKQLSPSYVKAQMVAAALTVPDVVSAQCFITGLKNRQLTGQVQVTDAAGNLSAAAF